MGNQILPRFVDIRTARKMYSLSRCKLLELIYDRKIVATKKTGKWLIKTQSIEDFLMEESNNLELKIKTMLENVV